ncbi:unnamed protein product [Fasciola hepatica]|uniref:Uncharacterized protein n=1 Tax=Fasciola hepatica TaxID=6192 RepID=A0ABC9HHG2_FASHE
MSHRQRKGIRLSKPPPTAQETSGFGLTPPPSKLLHESVALQQVEASRTVAKYCIKHKPNSSGFPVDLVVD